MRRDVLFVAGVAAVLLGATHAFSRVYADGSWRPATLAAAALALGVAALCRRARLGAAATGVAGAVGLAAFTVLVHLPGTPPTSTWSELTALLGRGLTQFQNEPSPTAPLDGLMLLTTSGTWVVTHLAYELLRSGRAMAALLPPTVLWAVPLSVPLPPGRTWPHALPFLATAGLVLLVERRSDGHQEARTRAVQPSGIVLVGVALALAVALAGLTPGYGTTPWLDRVAASSPRGYQPIVDVGDRLHLPEARDVLEVHADRRLYLRLAGLDTFDGTTWRLGPEGAGTYRPPATSLHPTTRDLPPEVAIARSEQVQAHVEVLDLDNIYVPVPYQPVRVTGPARDRMLYSTVGGFVATTTRDGDGERLVSGVRSGLQYGVVAQIPDPAAAELTAVDPDPAAVSRWLELPSDYPDLAAVTRDVLEQAAATTQLDKALAVQDHFVGPGSDFTYSTEVDSLRGSGALRDFVLETHTGYCEYFATAMAVMLRTAGVPARVAVGFLGGREVASPPDVAPFGLKTYRVSTRDAHAWVEVLFPGYGWIRFEPTPRSDGSVQVPTRSDLDPLLTREEEQRGQVEETPASPAQPAPVDDLDAVLDDPATQLDGFEPSAAPASDGRAGALGIAGVALLLAATAAGALAAAWRRWPRHPELADRDRVLAAQAQLERRAAGYGLGRRDPETARDLAVRWTREGRVDRGAAQHFATLAQAAAFAADVDTGVGEEAERLAEAVASDLRASVRRVDRLVAPARLPLRAMTTTMRQIAGRAREIIGAPR